MADQQGSPTSLGLSPAALGRAFRETFPNYRTDIQTDEELYQHLAEKDPHGIAKLVGPGKPQGAYLPAPGDTAKAYGQTPLPTVPSRGNALTTAASTALRVAPPLAVGVATSMGALPTFGATVPAGLAASGGAAMAGESMAQKMEESLGLREGIEPKLIGTAGVFGSVPGLPLPPGLSTAVRVGARVAEGAGQGLLQQETERRLLKQPAPSLGERGVVAAVGGAFGAGAGAIEARSIAKSFEQAAEQVRRRTMTRQGLAGTIASFAQDAEMAGHTPEVARRYARDVAKALYAGRELPEFPQPAYPTEYRDAPTHSAEETYLREAGWKVDPRENRFGDVRRWYKKGAPPLPEPEPHGPYDQSTERAADALGASLEQPPAPAGLPRMVAPDAGKVTARPALEPPDAATRAGAQKLAAAGTKNALGALPQFTSLDEGAVPAPRAGDVPPTLSETRKFNSTAKSAAKQQATTLSPPMESPLGSPSAATSKLANRLETRGVRQAVKSADSFTRLDTPPHVQGEAAMAAFQRPDGSVEAAQEAARTALPPPPAAAAPTTKDVVLVNAHGEPVGTVQVPDTYAEPVIGEAEYNSLYAPGGDASLPHPLDPSGERGAIPLTKSEPIDFTAAPGDTPALRDWLARRSDLKGQGFYKRAEQALAAKNPARAWQILQAEQLRQRSPAQAMKAVSFANLRGELGSVREQQGGVRRTTQFPEPSPAKRGQFGQLTLRASGLKDVGDLPERTTITALPPEVHAKVIKAIDRARLGRIKGNTDTDYRLFRQVASQVLEREPKMRAISRAIGLTPEELASGWTSQVTEAARLLQKLSRLSSEIPNVITETEARSGVKAPKGLRAALADLREDASADESLQKLYGGLFALDPAEALAWVRRSADAMSEVHAQHLLEQSANKGPLAAFNDLRRAGLTGTIAAFWRNAAVGGIRWNAGILSDSLGAILSVDPQVRRELAGRAKDRLTAAPHLWNTIAKPWGSSMFEMWPKLATAVTEGRDPRKTLKAISSFTDAEAHFLGTQQKDLPQSTGQQQYVTLIQSANRAQEYPLRALASDLRLRQLVRRRGFDPNTVLNDPADLSRVFGSPEAAERAVQDAVGYGLDYTFASDTITGTINKAMIDTINSHPFLSAFQAFPRYAWSAAPRFVWDHSPGVLLDMATQVLTSGKVRLGQRFMRGQQTSIASEMLGRRETRLHELSLDRGRVLQETLALTKQQSILRRRIETLEGYEAKGTITNAQGQRLGEMRRELQEVHGAIGGHRTNLGRLGAEESTIKGQTRKLAKGYEESAKAAAPESYGEILGKAAVGMGLWSAFHALRSSKDQQDLPWYKIRVGDTVADTRAFGPLTFFLFFGDLTADLARHTDTGEYRAKMAEKVAGGQNKVAASVEALRESYHGKYTEGQALREGAQLAFGLSPAAGVTAAFYDMLAPDGLTIDNLGERALQVVGEWLAGPLQPLSDVSNLMSLVDPGEAVIRDPGMIAPETPFAELSAPLTKIPGVKQLFPEQYSQTSGEVVKSESPITRTIGGITLAKPPNAVESVLQEAGVPGNKYHLPRLDDVGLTQQLSKVHADSLRQMYDEFIRGNPDWNALKTPEERRTYLEMPGGPLAFARQLTWAAMQDFGEEKLQGLRESPARRAAAERQLRLLERWSGENAPATEDPQTAPGEVVPPPLGGSPRSSAPGLRPLPF